MAWFEVSKGGLKQLQGDKDKSFILKELVQNAWDEDGVTRVDITLSPHPSRHSVIVKVEDDSDEGFYDLSHAYTLYAETRKRSNPDKRGRFNIGEKLVLSLCRWATITTTKGTIKFLRNGERKKTSTKTAFGSIFEAEIPMKREEIKELVKVAKTFIPPEEIDTFANGELIEPPNRVTHFKTTLQTEFEQDGVMKPSSRKTEVEVFHPRNGEVPMLYEMGLPVIETGDRYHYNVCQRVPLNSDRDNVKPAFLKDLRAEVLNRTVDLLDEDEVSEEWVRQGASDKRVQPETVRAVAGKRWGENRVVLAPGDSHSREQALSRGFTVVAPKTMSKSEWEQMKKANAIPAGSELFPRLSADYELVSSMEWTDAQREVVRLTKRISSFVFDFEVDVEIIKSKANIEADYSKANKRIRFNATRLKKSWWGGPRQYILELIIHELGHEHGGHLDRSYHDTLCKIGATLAVMPSETLWGTNE
jgi:hypothetical protein